MKLYTTSSNKSIGIIKFDNNKFQLYNLNEQKILCNHLYKKIDKTFLNGCRICNLLIEAEKRKLEDIDLRIPEVKEELIRYTYNGYIYQLFTPKPFVENEFTKKLYTVYENLLLSQMRDPIKKSLYIPEERVKEIYAEFIDEDIEFIQKCINNWENNNNKSNKILFLTKSKKISEKELKKESKETPKIYTENFTTIVGIFTIKIGTDYNEFNKIVKNEFRNNEYYNFQSNYFLVSLGETDSLKKETLKRYFSNMFSEIEGLYAYQQLQFNEVEYCENLFFALGDSDYFLSPSSSSIQNNNILDVSKTLLMKYNGLETGFYEKIIRTKNLLKSDKMEIEEDIIDPDEYAPLKMLIQNITLKQMNHLHDIVHMGKTFGHFYISRSFFYESKEEGKKELNIFDLDEEENLSYMILLNYLIGYIESKKISDITILSNPIIETLLIDYDLSSNSNAYFDFRNKIFLSKKEVTFEEKIMKLGVTIEMQNFNLFSDLNVFFYD
mgnify:FL=1